MHWLRYVELNQSECLELGPSTAPSDTSFAFALWVQAQCSIDVYTLRRKERNSVGQRLFQKHFEVNRS